MPFRKRMPRTKILRARELRKNPTKAESIVWDTVKGKQCGVRVHRQTPTLGYIADFWVPRLKLIIEIDGSIHSSQVGYDRNRDSIMQSHGLRVARFKNEDIYRDRTIVSRFIIDALTTP
jgi:leucyl-tRNA synthetase